MVLKTMTKIYTLFRLGSHKQVYYIGSPLVRTCSCLRDLTTLDYNFTARNLATRAKRSTGGSKVNSLDPDKVKIISLLNFKLPEDAEPFYELPVLTLQHIQKVTLNDKKSGFCENRLYYISSRIQCPPALVSEKIAKRSFVYRLSFDWLERSLNELIEKGVRGDRIIRDLWVLKYHHATISERLQRIRDMGIDNVYPWMVRCSPTVLDRYMDITKETKEILGDTKSTQMYLANRLNISIEEVEDICMRITALKTIRVTKVKKFLDFLIDEGYDVKEIADKPRILASSQNTVKHRLQELRQLGVKYISLNVLCRSRKDYKKFHDSFYNKT